MTGGFRAVLPELLGVSGVFERESRMLSDVVPGAGPQVPDGGDGLINAALADAVRAAALTTGQYAAVVGGFGQKLRTAHDQYEAADHASAGRARSVIGLLPGAPGIRY
jgi:hypothetical protein